MEVPIDGRFLQQFNMISRRNAAEGSHGLAVKIPCILVNAVVVVVVQNGCGQRERPILELLRYPVIRLSILPLEAHVLRHRLIHEGHRQGNHRSVIGDIPVGFHAFFHYIQLVKGIEQSKVILCRHAFFLDEVILRQIDCLIVHKGRRVGQRRHQPQQAVMGHKGHDCLFHLVLQTAVHHQHSHIQRLQHHLGGFLQRVIYIGLCRFLRRNIAFSVLAGLDLIAVIPHPVGTGLRKQIVHNAVPLNS